MSDCKNYRWHNIFFKKKLTLKKSRKRETYSSIEIASGRFTFELLNSSYQLYIRLSDNNLRYHSISVRRATIILFLFFLLLQTSRKELSTEEERRGGLSVSMKLHSLSFLSSRVTGRSRIDSLSPYMCTKHPRVTNIYVDHSVPV